MKQSDCTLDSATVEPETGPARFPVQNSRRDADLRLGHLLVQGEYLSEDQLKAALQSQANLRAAGEYRPLGAILVSTGYITSDQLREALDQQTRAWKGRRVIGKYLLLEKIGEGGMGAVWKARHQELGSTLAIKLLPRALVSNEALVKRFTREAKFLATANHTNIVQAFDAGEVDGQPFFAMPYLDGADLGTILAKTGRIGIRTALSLTLQAARGLGYAHSMGLVHRDMKPENIFLTNDGTIKILDLGLTKLVEDARESQARLTTVGMIVGTPGYMAPEQIQSDPNLDGRADIYGLGATLFELLTGRMPFEHKNVAKLLKAKMNEAPPSIRAFQPEVPQGVCDLVMRMLSIDPNNRPQDCSALEAELEALLDGRVVSGSSLSPGSIVLGLSERDTLTYNLSNKTKGVETKETIKTKMIESDPSPYVRGNSTRSVLPVVGTVAHSSTRLNSTTQTQPLIKTGWGQLVAAVLLVALSVAITLLLTQ